VATQQNDVQYTRVTWDPGLRILTKEASSSEAFENASTLKWRYAEGGRVIAYIGVEQPFQHDYRYDEHGNEVDFYLSYPGTPDLMTPSGAAPWMGNSFVNEYDGDTLVGSVETPYGDGNVRADGAPMPSVKRTYSEENGRCVGVESVSENATTHETRTYDDSNRLLDATVEGPRLRETKRYTYDDDGRLLTMVVSGSGGFSGPWTSTTTHAYLPDASERIEMENGFTDVLSARHTVVTRTAACLAIDEEIGTRASARCLTR
jgi:hypothetical protein